MSLSSDFLRKTWAGKAGLAPYEPLTADESGLFDYDFGRLLNWLKDIDAYLAVKFQEDRENYRVAAGIHKKQMTLEFGGLEPSTGQFGFCIIPSRPLFATSATPGAQNTWLIAVAAGWANWWGTAADPLNGIAAAPNQRGYYIQGLFNVAASTTLSAIKVGVGGYVYPCLSYQLEARTHMLHKVITYFPLPKNILCHCTGSFYIRAAFEQAGNEEILPLGLMFAEYDYINAEASFYA